MNDTMMIRNPETNEWESVYLPPTGDTYPIGAYAFIAGEKAPTGWLRCDGQAVSRTEYAGLFNVIGTTYGAGDGSTTFNLPNVNLGNRTLVGSSGDGEFALGNTMGEKEHTLTVDELPKHKPSILLNTNDSNVSGSAANYQATSKGRFYSADMFQNIGGGQSHNNMQPSIAAICIIKAKQSIGIVGAVTDDINDQNDNAVVNAKTIKSYVDNKTLGIQYIPSNQTSNAFTPEFDCYAEIYYSVAGWAYGGGKVDLNITCTQGNAEEVQVLKSGTQGHDSVPDAMFAMGVFKLNKGTEYKFRFSAATGGNIAMYSLIKLIPRYEV